MKKNISFIISMALAMLMITGSAMAQTGIRAGAFTINPKLTLGMEYNDNIYATKNNKKSDWTTTLTPSVSIDSNWSRHALGLNAKLSGGVLTSKSNENYVDADLSLEGRLDVLRESFFTAGVGYKRLHEERGSPDSVDAWKEPAVYHITSGKLNYHHGINRFSFVLGGEVHNVDYERVKLEGGGSQNLDIRDRNQYNVSARVAYELHPDVQPFITTHYDWRRYRKSEAEKDSEGYRIGLGTGFGLTGKTSGEIFGGYMWQKYDDRKDIDGFWYGISLNWEATQLTTVNANVRSSIKETYRDGSSGVESVDTGISIDHELLRNLSVGAFLDYSRNDYKGENITDNYYTFGPSVTYGWNRYLSANFKYSHKVKDSNSSDREYSQNKFAVSLTGQF